MRVAGILDPFSQTALQYEFLFEPLLAGTWHEQVESFAPDLLLVEASWSGSAGSWTGLVATLRDVHPALRDLISWCRERGVPTVFWGKEDPPNYTRFVRAAALFDFVFTVDAESVERYRSDLGHERVGLLPFAAQPVVHHPFLLPGESRADRGVAFAGTYFRQKYAERRSQMETVLDPAREFGLHIYSRAPNAGPNAWPRKYQSHLVGTVPYEEMAAVYKNYAVFLNVGSVPASATMCPRRLFELLASGTVVLSARLRALETFFGAHIVATTGGASETRSVLRKLLDEPADRERRRTLGVHRVLREHTYERRVETILATVYDRPPAVDRASTLVLEVEGSAGRDDIQLAVTEATTRRAVEQVIVRGVDKVAMELSDVLRTDPRVHVAPSTIETRASALRYAAAKHPERPIAVMSTQHRYGHPYVVDGIAALGCRVRDVAGAAAYRTASGKRESGGASWAVAERVHPDSMVLTPAAVERASDAELTEGWASGGVVSLDGDGFVEHGASGPRTRSR